MFWLDGLFFLDKQTFGFSVSILTILILIWIKWLTGLSASIRVHQWSFTWIQAPTQIILLPWLNMKTEMVTLQEFICNRLLTQTCGFPCSSLGVPFGNLITDPSYGLLSQSSWLHSNLAIPLWPKMSFQRDGSPEKLIDQ